ncbi:50S ribosomal protein L35ae [Candidatus Woesearchaeota archaeon]|nr:MAG: 50S ribosomal protein L35ae [Candidatus Woesearchaeota archaeon]
MEGTINNFRQGRHTQKMDHILISVEGYDKEKAKSLVGKKVVWKTPTGKEINGEIKALHGNKGVVRAIFEKGLPGQALGTKVKIL